MCQGGSPLLATRVRWDHRRLSCQDKCGRFADWVGRVYVALD